MHLTTPHLLSARQTDWAAILAAACRASRLAARCSMRSMRVVRPPCTLARTADVRNEERRPVDHVSGSSCSTWRRQEELRPTGRRRRIRTRIPRTDMSTVWGIRNLCFYLFVFYFIKLFYHLLLFILFFLRYFFFIIRFKIWKKAWKWN